MLINLTVYLMMKNSVYSIHAFEKLGSYIIHHYRNSHHLLNCGNNTCNAEINSVMLTCSKAAEHWRLFCHNDVVLLESLINIQERILLLQRLQIQNLTECHCESSSFFFFAIASAHTATMIIPS